MLQEIKSLHFVFGFSSMAKSNPDYITGIHWKWRLVKPYKSGPGWFNKRVSDPGHVVSFLLPMQPYHPPCVCKHILPIYADVGRNVCKEKIVPVNPEAVHHFKI